MTTKFEKIVATYLIAFIALLIFAMAGLSDTIAVRPQESPLVPRDFLPQSAKRLTKDLEWRLKTTYTPDGRPVNQGIDAKGLHYVAGNVKLVSGRAIVELNTSTSEGRQDVSFIGATTYSGVAWSTDTSNANSYSVMPMSGIKFLVRSSSGTDTMTVYYRITGE